MKIIIQALSEVGFEKEGEYFKQCRCLWIVEFVMSPVAVGSEVIYDFEVVQVPTGTIKMLRVEDCLKDRLASYFCWGDRQALSQAIQVCLECKVDFGEIKKWALKEGFEVRFNHFMNEINSFKK